MRKTGYVLLLVGFALICEQQFYGFMRTGIREVLDDQYAQLSQDADKTYTTREVYGHIRSAVDATYDLYPYVILPGLLMFAGGLILARTKRREKATQDA